MAGVQASNDESEAEGCHQGFNHGRGEGCAMTHPACVRAQTDWQSLSVRWRMDLFKTLNAKAEQEKRAEEEKASL